MIITEIKQIDSLVEQAFANGNSIVSVDANDYNTIKTQSASLKAVTLDASEWGEVCALDGELKEAGAGATNVLIHLGASDAGAVSMAQMRILLDMIHSNTDNANVVWGVYETETSAFKILVVLGYSD